ncbi:MAG: DUF288 domain-containing protein [Phycisphaerales bacterium]|nr:DUF288 domain-containing protein [Phycisphaerales bacterium]
MTSSTSIVITTIHHPTDAVRAFAALPGHRLVVVGDRKSPPGWACAGAEYLSVDDQLSRHGTFARLLPFNHYGRKMLGYVQAIEAGADVIVDTDDDNIPKEDWRFPPFDGTFDEVNAGQEYFNAYTLFTDQHIWPRGLPLDRILRPSPAIATSPAACRVGVWQGLADEDPDVDAIYRLVVGEPCTFRERAPVVLAHGTLCPWNSQNTAIRRELFPLLYLPVTVTFRFTDILRSLVAQPIMAAAGFKLGFMHATVVQRRNPHDPMADFESEVPMYRHCRAAVELTRARVSPDRSVSDNLVTAYGALAEAGIVEQKELGIVEAWLDALCAAKAAF